MIKLFNLNNQGAAEINSLTGNYYRSNNYDSLKPFIEDEIYTLSKFVGEAVIELASEIYIDEYSCSDSSSNSNIASDPAEILKLVRTPVAILAVFRYNQANIISHEDSGRKFKIDPENEKMPWSWMYDRDDAAALRRAYQSIDKLIEYLSNRQISQWLQSEAYKASRRILITSTSQFNNVFPIDNSHRFFYKIVPFIAETQRQELIPVIGKDRYEDILEELRNNNISDDNSEIYSLICDWLPLAAMIRSIKRINVQVWPEGVFQRIISSQESRNASGNIVPAETLKKFISDLEKDAFVSLESVKKYIFANDTEAQDFPLLPNNSSNNKFFRT
jgi:hypothetical protein